MSVSSNILDESSRKELREEVACDGEIESPINDNDDDQFLTTSIRVLLVDADSSSLLLMKNLMTQYSYQVTEYENGKEAVAFLMKSKHDIDLVIWDFHMPDINGLDALCTIGKEMDLPVVIMSHDHKKETVMKSTKYGACDFLVKPVGKEVIAVLWQHVFRKRMMSKSGSDRPPGDESETVESDQDEYDELGQDNLCHSNEEGSKNTSDQKGDKSSPKKPRMAWTPELHHKFELAVQKIGSIDKAFPKTILKYMQEQMNVQGLTRNNIASHLQKYRQNQNNTKKTRTHQETTTHQEDFVWRSAGPDAALPASNPLLTSSINLQARASYLVNDQAAAAARASYFMKDQGAVNAPIQYSSHSYLAPMNNNYFMTTNPSAYIEQFQPQPQQQYHSSLPFPSVPNKQEHGHVSSTMDLADQLIYNTTFPFDHEEFLLPPGFNNFDQIGRH